MKKIPTLFKREFDPKTHKIISISADITPGCEEAFRYGFATIKYDGSACWISPDGNFYKRYDVRKGKSIPECAIACQLSPDEETGHWPHWVPVTEGAADKWFVAAYIFAEERGEKLLPGVSYEAIGPHFQGNPYMLSQDIILQHGNDVVELERTFDGVRRWLEANPRDEGLVFWYGGAPVCKIKRTDFGLKWNKK